MPKVAMFFLILLFSPVITNSHAFIPVDLNTNDSQNVPLFNSDIVQIDPNFFVENNFKRYLIFGNNLEQNDFLKSEIKGFDTTLKYASSQIDENIGTFALSAKSISESSAQLNALLLPIIASIGLIVALQIAILARRR